MASVTDKIKVMEGDLTEMEVDAIVNAANNDLKLGAGVAGAIRKKGGPGIQQECDKIGTINVGGAAITGAGNLKAGHVIHAASMSLGGRTTEPNLRSSVKESLRLANENGLKSIAFPAIGTGIAGFPLDRCAEVMMEEARAHLEAGSSLEGVYFVLFGNEAYQTFNDVYKRMA
jgi:O-acetyl-ADP-ribose deacetylase (regulator of RNase III)